MPRTNSCTAERILGEKNIIVGKIVGAHGIRGELKLASYTADPRAIAEFPLLHSEDGKRTFRLKVRGAASAQGKDYLIVQIEGVTDRNAAELLKNITLTVPRDALPEAEEDEVYHEDLVGLAVKLADGTVFGRVAAVQNYGASDIIEIAREGQKQTEMFAFTDENFPEINLRDGWLLLNLPEEV
jgi:16S rRNA processing protein RimM